MDDEVSQLVEEQLLPGEDPLVREYFSIVQSVLLMSACEFKRAH